MNIVLPIIFNILGAQKNHLIETILLSTQHMFWLRNKKITLCYALLTTVDVVP